MSRFLLRFLKNLLVLFLLGFSVLWLVVLCGLWLLPSEDPINDAMFGAVRPGMTHQEVVDLVGGPATTAAESISVDPFGPKPVVRTTTATWAGTQGALTVRFDAEGKVVDTNLVPFPEPGPTGWDRFRRRLGL